MKQKTLDQQIKINRKKIDQIDRKLAELLQRRILLSQEIFQNKKKLGKKIIDKKRESEILKRYLKNLESITTSERVAKFIRSLLQINPKYLSHRKSKENYERN